MTDNTTRRAFLGALGTGSAALLAGCGQPNKPDVDTDPNAYDYQYVDGRELAVNLPAYRDDPVTTETRVSFDSDYLPIDDESAFRLYTARPEDTVHTFPVAELLDGPIYDELGETIHSTDHDDTRLQLYGRPQEVSDWEEDGYNSGMAYHDYVLVVEDAARPGMEPGTPTDDR